jgi:hypothetical protein
MIQKLAVLPALVIAIASQTFAADSVPVRAVPGAGANQQLIVPLPPASPVIVQAQPAKNAPPGEINFLAMGDWGQASEHQKIVAQELATYAGKVGKIQCMVTAGDNFYVKMPLGVNDPAWRTVFEDMYDARRLDFPWFITYGNHDFEFGKAPIELQYARDNPDSRWKFPARWYRLDMMAKGSDKPVMSILMLDSNRQVASDEEWEAQKSWMDEQLSAMPQGVWTMCICHHPPFTNGDHGDNGKLQVEWGPIIKKHHLDAFICGHDHDLQHLELPGWTTTFMLVGGGGGKIRPMLVDNRGPFSRSIYGFAHVSVTPEKMTVHYVSETGEDLHTFERTKAGDVKVLSSTASDKATTKKLKTIQGIDGNKKSGDD